MGRRFRCRALPVCDGRLRNKEGTLIYREILFSDFPLDGNRLIEPIDRMNDLNRAA